MKDITAQEDLDIMSTLAQQEPMELAELEREMSGSAFHAHQEITVQKPVPLQHQRMQATIQCSQDSHLQMLYTSVLLVTIVQIQA